MLDLIKKHLAALSSSNWADYKASLAPDAVYEETATMLRKKGADEYINAVQVWKRAFPDLKGTVLTGYVSGDRVFAEVEWEGTQTGPFEGPLGTIPATGKRGTIKGAMLVTMKGDKIVETHHYFDLLTVLRQLGAVPTMGVPAPAPKVTQPSKH